MASPKVEEKKKSPIETKSEEEDEHVFLGTIELLFTHPLNRSRRHNVTKMVEQKCLTLSTTRGIVEESDRKFDHRRQADRAKENPRWRDVCFYHLGQLEAHRKIMIEEQGVDPSEINCADFRANVIFSSPFPASAFMDMLGKAQIGIGTMGARVFLAVPRVTCVEMDYVKQGLQAITADKHGFLGQAIGDGAIYLKNKMHLITKRAAPTLSLSIPSAPVAPKKESKKITDAT